MLEGEFLRLAIQPYLTTLAVASDGRRVQLSALFFFSFQSRPIMIGLLCFTSFGITSNIEEIFYRPTNVECLSQLLDCLICDLPSLLQVPVVSSLISRPISNKSLGVSEADMCRSPCPIFPKIYSKSPAASFFRATTFKPTYSDRD